MEWDADRERCRTLVGLVSIDKRMIEYALIFLSYGSFGSAGIFEMKGTRFEEWIEVEKVFGLYRGILFWWTNEIIVGNIDPFLLHEFVHFFFFFLYVTSTYLCEM